jgi:hypothetical protein
MGSQVELSDALLRMFRNHTFDPKIVEQIRLTSKERNINIYQQL